MVAGDNKRVYKSYLFKVVSSSEDSLTSNGDSEEDPDTIPIPVSGAFPPTTAANVETHSDSDADAERSGAEDCPQASSRKSRRKVLRLRRKKNVEVGKKRDGTGEAGVGILAPKQLFTGDPPKSENIPSDAASQQPAHQTKEEIPTKSVITPGVVAGNVVAADALEPNVVISQLGNLVQMTDASSIFQDYVTPPDNIDGDGSDGSYSSRMSNKSEKNMADFDGEDSNCDEDSLMQSLAQNQMAEMMASGVMPPGQRNQQVSLGDLGSPIFAQRSLRRFNHQQRKRDGGKNGAPGSIFNFQIDNVCQPGQTLLWDLVQDDTITQLSEGLAIEAQKALTNLLCFSTDKLIRFKFIEGCLDNLVKDKSVVVSLRLLPKLLTSFQQLRLTHHTTHAAAAAAAAEIHQVTLWADKEHQMLQKFFTNLQEFTKMGRIYPYPYHIQVQARLEFLSVLFSILSSPDDFR